MHVTTIKKKWLCVVCLFQLRLTAVLSQIHSKYVRYCTASPIFIFRYKIIYVGLRRIILRGKGLWNPPLGVQYRKEGGVTLVSNGYVKGRGDRGGRVLRAL